MRCRRAGLDLRRRSFLTTSRSDRAAAGPGTPIRSASNQRASSSGRPPGRPQKAVQSKEVAALGAALARRGRPRALPSTCSLPWNIRCSKRWANPCGRALVARADQVGGHPPRPGWCRGSPPRKPLSSVWRCACRDGDGGTHGFPPVVAGAEPGRRSGCGRRGGVGCGNVSSRLNRRPSPIRQGRPFPTVRPCPAVGMPESSYQPSPTSRSSTWSPSWGPPKPRRGVVRTQGKRLLCRGRRSMGEVGLAACTWRRSEPKRRRRSRHR